MWGATRGRERLKKADPGKEALPSEVGTLNRKPGHVRPFSRIRKYTHSNERFRVRRLLLEVVFHLIVKV